MDAVGNSDVEVKKVSNKKKTKKGKASYISDPVERERVCNKLAKEIFHEVEELAKLGCEVYVDLESQTGVRRCMGTEKLTEECQTRRQRLSEQRAKSISKSPQKLPNMSRDIVTQFPEVSENAISCRDCGVIQGSSEDEGGWFECNETGCDYSVHTQCIGFVGLTTEEAKDCGYYMCIFHNKIPTRVN